MSRRPAVILLIFFQLVEFSLVDSFKYAVQFARKLQEKYENRVQFRGIVYVHFGISLVNWQLKYDIAKRDIHVLSIYTIFEFT
jgi:hypothetical protein